MSQAFSGISHPGGLAVADDSGGYAVFVKNAMRLPTGEGGGFSLRFCSIAELSMSQSSGRKLVWLETARKVNGGGIDERDERMGKQEILAHFMKKPHLAGLPDRVYDTSPNALGALDIIGILLGTIVIIGCTYYAVFVYSRRRGANNINSKHV